MRATEAVWRAISENKEVIARYEERIELLRKEVEGRGFRWDEEWGRGGEGQMGEADGMHEAGKEGSSDNNSDNQNILNY